LHGIQSNKCITCGKRDNAYFDLTRFQRPKCEFSRQDIYPIRQYVAK